MLFKLMTLVHICAAFPLKCPEPAQWRLRTNSHCADPSKYFCLRNDIINGYSENCTRSDFQQAGRKSVLRGGIDAVVCSKERYQPSGYTLYTNASTNCILLKSFCNEEGQVVYDHGNRTTDATCMCNYRQGFAFLIKPINPCFCTPSQEDCSCFLKICSNSSHILSPDYKCTMNSDLPPVTHCRTITDVENDNSGRTPDVKETFPKEDNVSVLILEPWKERSVTAILSIFGGTLTLVLFILVVCIRQFKAFENNGPEPELYLIEGDTLILQYMLPIKRLRLFVFKDDTLIHVAETVNVKKHVFEKTNVTLEDQGNYFAKVCNIRSRITTVTVQSMFTSEFNPIKCMEGELLQLNCSVYSEDIIVEWSKDDIKIKQNENISIEIDGKNHFMTVKNAQLSDAGQYAIVAGNVRKQRTVTVEAMFTSDFNQIHCIVGEKLQLECSVCLENINVEWFKNDEKIFENENISLKSDGKDHFMSVQQAEMMDAGQYAVIAGNVQKQLTVTVTVKVLPEAINRLQEKDRARYIELMQSSEVEKRYFVRIMIVGKESVGKTCLVRRLLMQKIDDVTSTDGVEIVVNQCKINIEDGTWLIDDASDDKIDRISRALTSVPNKSTIEREINISRSKETNNGIRQVEVVANFLDDINRTTLYQSEISVYSKSKGTTSGIDIRSRFMSTNNTKDNEQIENVHESNTKDNENLTKSDSKDTLTEHENTNHALSLVMPRDLMARVFSTTSASNIPSKQYALCGLWDFAGQKEFYATHQAFLTNSAIYLVVADMKDEISKQNVSQYSAEFKNVGEYVDFWFDTIHCHRSVEPSVDEPFNDFIEPPVILVLTGKDKCEKETFGNTVIEERKTELQTQLGTVLGAQSKYHHLRDIVCLSNTTDPDVKFVELQQKISSIIIGMAHWGQNLPLKWILLEHLIEINKSDGNNFINLSDMNNLAKHTDINMTDIDDVKLFLRFQHEVGNIIYFEDIQDFIILNPKWLVDAFRCLVSDRIDDKLQHRDDWTIFVRHGQITESLIAELFKSKCGSQFSDQRDNLLKVMEKFDILVKIGDTPSYIMPSMMPSASFDEICTQIGVEQPNCQRTSWLCLKFSFLPPSFFNHISVWFIRKYDPSKVGNEKKSLSLFRGICVFDITKFGCEKLLVTMSTDTIAIQLLSFSTRKPEFGSLCVNIRKDLIEKIQSIKDRYKLKISNEIHFKCSTGRYFEDTISYESLKNSIEYYCSQHKAVHQSEQTYSPWITNSDDNLVQKEVPVPIGFSKSVVETQGREVETRSTEKMVNVEERDDSDDDGATNPMKEKQQAFHCMSLEELENHHRDQTKLKDCPDNFITEIALEHHRNQPKKMEEEVEPDFSNPACLETPSIERKNIKKNRPVRLRDFEGKFEELHKDSNLRFAHEYEELKTLTDPKTLKGVTTLLAETEENKLKNRYVNILPYDHTIVKLLPLGDDDEEASTFINANYIPGYKSQREYIASQGPIPSTIDDFWRMVWEQSVSVIVMLTLVKEDDRIKCETYWPTEQSEAKQYGNIVVDMQSCATINTYEIRIFKLTLGDKSRTLKHFHFLNWKDFSAKVQNYVMVDFISSVRSRVTIHESRVPMIVHCSTGVGRTGTFIALDHMMQFIKDHDFNSTIDIFDFVVKMRKCRMYMVQTEQQYIFIHECIKDILEEKRQKEIEEGEEPDQDLYQNVDMAQPKTEL